MGGVRDMALDPRLSRAGILAEREKHLADRRRMIENLPRRYDGTPEPSHTSDGALDDLLADRHLDDPEAFCHHDA